MFKKMFKIDKFTEESLPPYAKFEVKKNTQMNQSTHPYRIVAYLSKDDFEFNTSGFGGTGVSTGDGGLGNYAGTYRSFKEIENYFNNLGDEAVLGCGGYCDMTKGHEKYKELYPEGLLEKLRNDYEKLQPLTPATPTTAPTSSPTTAAPAPTTAPTTGIASTAAPTTGITSTAAPTTDPTASVATTVAPKETTVAKKEKKNNTGIIIGVIAGIIALIIVLYILHIKSQ
jgi:hypothetical protein